MSESDPTTRGHRGLIAVAIVLGSGVALWLATVTLVRTSARARVANEIQRWRATGPMSYVTEEWEPLPPAADDGMLVLRRITSSILWREGSEAGDSARRVFLGGDPWPSEDELLRAPWTQLDPECLALARAAADLPALGVTTDWERRDEDLELVRRAGYALSRAARSAAGAHDHASARTDVQRVLRLRVHAVRRRAWDTHVVQRSLTRAIAHAIVAALDCDDAPREWFELDAPLAEIDSMEPVRRELRWECADEIARDDEALREGLLWSPGTDAWWEWPWSWPQRADELAAFARFDALARTSFAAVSTAPDFEPSSPGTGCFPASGPRWTHDLAGAAREQALVTLARAALRARFDGAEFARAFLAQHADPFTGGELHARVDANGTWTAWCTGLFGAAASGDRPDARYDVVWPPRE